MSDDDVISEFMSGHTFPAAAFPDPDTCRIWYQYLDDQQAVFSIGPGETDDDAELLGIADTVMKALVAAHPEYAALTFRIEEE